MENQPALGSSSSGEHDRLRTRFLGVIATIAILWFLKMSAAVIMPLMFGLFLAALFWPLQQGLQRRIRQGAALIVTLLVLLAILAGFVWGLKFCADRALEAWPQYQPRFQRIAQYWQLRLAPGNPTAGSPVENSASVVNSTAGSHLLPGLIKAGESFGLAVLVVAFMALLLLEVASFRVKLEAIGGHAHRLIASAFQVASLFRRYFLARTAIALIQGLCTWLFAWLVGLDLAIIWGVSSALLNYIPTLGSILAVFPPGLFAIVQFDNPWAAVGIIIGLSVIQLVLGNYIDPRLEGRYLHLSPVVVLFSIVGWGWLWGIPGALIGVPMTITIVQISSQFSCSRWLAILLSGRKRSFSEIEG